MNISETRKGGLAILTFTQESRCCDKNQDYKANIMVWLNNKKKTLNL